MKSHRGINCIGSIDSPNQRAMTRAAIDFPLHVISNTEIPRFNNPRDIARRKVNYSGYSLGYFDYFSRL